MGVASRAGLLAVVVALPAAAFARGEAPGGSPGAAEQLLRQGQYEKARRAADAQSRRKSGGVRATILAARAERHLGCSLRRGGGSRRPELLAPTTAAAGRVDAWRPALGDRGAVTDLVDRSYEDWQAGAKVAAHGAAELVAMAVALRFDNNWDDANANLRAAVKADPRATEANLAWGEIFLEKHAAGNAERLLPRRAEAGSAEPRRPRRPGAGAHRAELRRGGRRGRAGGGAGG